VCSGPEDDEEFFRGPDGDGQEAAEFRQLQAPEPVRQLNNGIRSRGTEIMLMIRLARYGAKKKPTYRLVVIDKERARNSRSVEVVGTSHPVSKPAVVALKHDRIEHWM